MTSPAHSEPTDRPVIHRGAVFVVVALTLLMMAIDSTIVATALDAIQEDMGAPINWTAWTITAYSLGFVLMLPVSGKLSHRYGRRRVFLLSVIVFTCASLCCGLAGNIESLIVLRIIQAAGGAGFTPSATGIIVDYFGDARDRAVSLFGSIFPIGALIGPIFGGLFVTYWSWRGIFFVNVPIGLAIILLSLHFIPTDPHRSHAGEERLDLVGMGLLGATLLAGMFAASRLGVPGSPVLSAQIIVPIVIALLALWQFLRHIHRSWNPFIAPRLISGPGFGVVNLINTTFGGLTSGAITLLPLYAANRYGMSAFDAGTLLIPQGIAAIALSIVAAFALRRTGHRPPMYVGISIIATGILLLGLTPPAGVSAYLWLAAGAFLTGAGRGTINPPSRNAGLQLAPDQASTIAALRTASLQIGAITTISVTTAILANVNDPATTQAWVYFATAGLMVIGFPLLTRMPEHRGAW